MKFKSLIAAIAVGLGLVSVSYADAYWRWTSNATAGNSATWTTVDSPTLSVPTFTGATAEDNVLEILDDCSVESILQFKKSCTIRTAPGLDVKKVTFVPNCYCISALGADIHTADITFTGGAQWMYPDNVANASLKSGTTAGNCAWAVVGTASLTLGSGTTICDFCPAAAPTGIDAYGGAIILPNKTVSPLPAGTYGSSKPELTISAGAKILNVRSGAQPTVTVADKMNNAVINMVGGEISGCYSAKSSSSKYGVVLVMNGTFNLSGGNIHDNYVLGNSNYSGVNVNGGTLNLSGTPIVRDNFIYTTPAALSNLRVSGTGSIHLAGDLEAGAYVGCSRNVGEGNPFGTVDGNFAGAKYIHADGSDLVGVVSGGNLVWGTAVGPEPNSWATSAAITKTSWIVGDDPGVVTVPVAQYNDELKKATISKDGATATTWDGVMPTEAGSYVITWTVPETDEYDGLTTSVSFTVSSPAPLVGAWRWWDANAAKWESKDSTTLTVPDFTGTTAEDNVIELIEDCSVASILTFNKSCTIRTAPGLEVKKVTITDQNVHCLVGNVTVKTLNVTFDGNNLGSSVWGLESGSLTLGDGVTICNFKPAKAKIYDSFGGVIMIKAGTLNILEGSKICDINGFGAAVTVINGTTSVVNMSGGEITRCNSTADKRGGGAIDMDSGTLNLSGGYIHDNSAKVGAGGICVVNDGKDGYIKVSGNPIVKDNQMKTTVSNVGLTDGSHGVGHFVLVGDLTAGADIGCSYNIGANNQFGTVDGNFAGAKYIHADGSDFVGVVSGGNLVWGTATSVGLMLIFD